MDRLRAQAADIAVAAVAACIHAGHAAANILMEEGAEVVEEGSCILPSSLATVVRRAARGQRKAVVDLLNVSET